jgi:uncharacterized protein YjbI with pentapeptide repeats
MKLARPRLLPQLEDGSIDNLLEGELSEVHLYDINAVKVTVLALDIDGVLLEKVGLLQAQLPRVTARDMVAKQCDFSSTTLVDGAFNRAEFINCRMTGVDFNKASVHDVLFRGCKLDMANFRFADVRRVQFVDCTFIESDFLGATLHDVRFESCTLEKVVFDQAKCKQVDLRTSQLVELSGWSSLKGAVIDTAQLMAIAPYLAQTIGIVVKE